MRVERAFAFMDLSGFTAFTEQHGDERAVLVLAELRSTLREAAARRGVRVVKWLGDGAMLSSPMADAVAALVMEVDARMAVTLPTVALRAGMDYGPVIMFEGDDYIGRSVNVASRLCDAARPHEVVATSTVSPMLPPWIRVDPLPRVAVKGIEGTVAVNALGVRAVEDLPEIDPVCGLVLDRSTMVGNDRSGWFCSEACRLSGPRSSAGGPLATQTI